MDKSPDAFRTISEVAEELDLPQHVLRFWETRFSQIKPMKRTGGRRYYRPEDVEIVRTIKSLLYGQGYTIKGVQRLFKENGMRAVVSAVRDGAPPGPTQAAFALDDAQASADSGSVEEDAANDASSEFGEPPNFSGQAFAADEAAKLSAELADCVRILRAARTG